MSVIRVTSLLFVIDRPPQLLQNPPVLNSYFGLDSGTYFRGGGSTQKEKRFSLNRSVC